GATETWNVRQDEYPAPGFDLVFEAAGTPAGARTAIDVARGGVTFVLEGIAGEPGGIDADAIVLGHLRVQGIFGASRNAWRWVTELFADGLLDTKPLVTHAVPLAERRGDVLKVVLTPQ